MRAWERPYPSLRGQRPHVLQCASIALTADSLTCCEDGQLTQPRAGSLSRKSAISGRTLFSQHALAPTGSRSEARDSRYFARIKSKITRSKLLRAIDVTSPTMTPYPTLPSPCGCNPTQVNDWVTMSYGWNFTPQVYVRIATFGLFARAKELPYTQKSRVQHETFTVVQNDRHLSSFLPLGCGA